MFLAGVLGGDEQMQFLHHAVDELRRHRRGIVAGNLKTRGNKRKHENAPKKNTNKKKTSKKTPMP